MATHSSILAWRISYIEGPGGLQSMESQSQTQLSDYHFHFHFITIFCVLWHLGMEPGMEPMPLASEATGS